jgi:hypothetical protein
MIDDPGQELEFDLMRRQLDSKKVHRTVHMK